MEKREKYGKIILTSLPIICGIYINSYYDLKFNLLGLIYGLCGVIVTSFYQIWAGEKQKEFHVNSLQLLYYLSPMSSLFLFFIIMASQPLSFNNLASNHEYDPYVAFLIIFLSCIFALLVNVSTYSLIRQTSPLTYNMIGHLKFCSTILGGYFIFHDPIQKTQVYGILLTMIGVLSYSLLKLKEQFNHKPDNFLEKPNSKYII
ncbi:unnamed protein product [Gordionus sp. m RMFG-2023]